AALRPFGGVVAGHGRPPLRPTAPRESKPQAPVSETPRPPAKAVPVNSAVPAIPAVPRPPSPVERRPAVPTPAALRDALGGSVPKAPATPPAPPVPATRAPSRTNLGIVKDRDACTWEERLGPVGIAVFAIVACAIAWYVTYRFF